MLRNIDDGGEWLLDQYLEARSEKAQAERKVKRLAGELMTALTGEENEEVYFKGKRISIRRKKIYKGYSEEVQKLQRQLKAYKQVEQQVGPAYVEDYTPYLTVEKDRREVPDEIDDEG